METLLTPTESLAFQSFLAAVDTSHPPNDWAAYASQFNPGSVNRDDDDIILDSMPPPPENESLTKATKDLMSLDAVGWSDASMLPPNQHQHQQQPLMYDHQIQQQHHQQSQPLLTQPLHRQHSYSSVHEPFPFLNSKGSNVPFQQQQQFAHPHPHQQQPLNLNHMNSPTTSADMFSFPPQHPQQQQQPHPSAHQPSIPSTAPATKRSIRSNSVRIPPSTNPPPVRQRRSSQSPRPSQGSAKPALLSPSQKKANHIQSEQKRRANIRRGYEALCDTVPALREAIREEEEEAKRAAALASAGSANGGNGSKGKASGKKRAAKKKEGDEGGSGSGAKDKIDGRAGPRSENVVLSKTIDYVHELLSERTTLLARLQKARSALPPGHPGLTPLTPDPAWEREWKGGEGKFGGDEEEEGEDSEGEGEGDDDSGPQVNGTKGKQRSNGASK